VVQDQAQITKFQSIKDDLPNLKKIIYWDDDGLKNPKDSLLLDFDAALKLGAEYEKTYPTVLSRISTGATAATSP